MAAISSSNRFQIFGEHSILFEKSSLFQTLGLKENDESNKNFILAIYTRVLDALNDSSQQYINAILIGRIWTEETKITIDAHVGGRICQVPAVIVASIFSSVAKPCKIYKLKAGELSDFEDLVNIIKKAKNQLFPLAKESAPLNLRKIDIVLENWAIYLIHLIFINSCHSVKICNSNGIVRKLAYCFDKFKGKYPVKNDVISNTLLTSKKWAFSLATTVVTEMLERTASLPDKELLSKILNIKLKINDRIEVPFFATTRTIFRTTNHPIHLKVRTLSSKTFTYQGNFSSKDGKYTLTNSIEGPTIVIEAYGNFTKDELRGPSENSNEISVIEKIILNYGGLIEYIEAQAAAHDQFSDLKAVAEKYNLKTIPKTLSLADLKNIDPSLLTLEETYMKPVLPNGYPDLTIEHVYLIMAVP